jgi:hypothetical protein
LRIAQVAIFLAESTASHACCGATCYVHETRLRFGCGSVRRHRCGAERGEQRTMSQGEYFRPMRCRDPHILRRADLSGVFI